MRKLPQPSWWGLTALQQDRVEGTFHRPPGPSRGCAEWQQQAETPWLAIRVLPAQLCPTPRSYIEVRTPCSLKL